MSNKNTTGCHKSHRKFSSCPRTPLKYADLVPVSSEDLLTIKEELISASSQQTIGSVQQTDAYVSHPDLINVFVSTVDKDVTECYIQSIHTRVKQASINTDIFTSQWAACIGGAKRKAPYFEVLELDQGDFLNIISISEKLLNVNIDINRRKVSWYG
ncbi:hypothetical protein RRG08_058009 [Elysia crispata]|uniref:Uncharacterized protein n=1 Tax=Elysia crispata TaxID=231223 RepID=A0AAE1E2J9_9GAST|nr:hypothetical protein RRG08_058009 [Elysia crispata]